MEQLNISNLLTYIGASSILTSTIVTILGIYIKKQFSKAENKNELRRHENVLIIKALFSIGKLTHANSIAIVKHETNGEMSEAIEGYKECFSQLSDFLIKVNANSK